MLPPAESTNIMLLSAGTLLIQESMMLPDALKIETSTYSHDWRVVTTEQKTLLARIGAAGWNFFFMVGKLKGTAFGTPTPANVRQAMGGLLRQVKDLHFNAVEIIGIRSSKAFGLVQYITISAHARHIQRSEQLETDERRKAAQDKAAWAIG